MSRRGQGRPEKFMGKDQREWEEIKGSEKQRQRRGRVQGIKRRSKRREGEIRGGKDRPGKGRSKERIQGKKRKGQGTLWEESQKI